MPRTLHSTGGFCAISQSGETKDVCRALDLAISNNLTCFSVVNSVRSLIARTTSCGVYLNAGRENGVASTKAFTCQVWCSQSNMRAMCLPFTPPLTTRSVLPHSPFLPTNPPLFLPGHCARTDCGLVLSDSSAQPFSPQAEGAYQRTTSSPDQLWNDVPLGQGAMY